MFYEHLVRPLLFRAFLDAETAHERALWLLQQLDCRPWLCAALQRLMAVADSRLRQTVFGLDFPNPIGLAAGFDKNGSALLALEALGFGSVEMGTITKDEQVGNERPRLFRLEHDQAVINRMGFNNLGVSELSMRLVWRFRIDRWPMVPVGINIGKSRSAALEEAVADYRFILRVLVNYGGYYVINISSPNTPGLRQLQERERLSELLSALRDYRFTNPMLVKIAPDLTLEAIDEVLAICLEFGIAGVIATNTTIARNGLRTKIDEVGGLSGRPLFSRALEIVRHCYRRVGEQLPIIGVGGISTVADVVAMLRAGASLVQVLTGLVYKEPFLARRLNEGLLAYMERRGIRNVAELRGMCS